TPGRSRPRRHASELHDDLSRPRRGVTRGTAHEKLEQRGQNHETYEPHANADAGRRRQGDGAARAAGVFDGRAGSGDSGSNPEHPVVHGDMARVLPTTEWQIWTA